MQIFMIAGGIAGDVATTGRVGQIMVLACDFGFGRFDDPATELPTGVVAPRLVGVTKNIDSASAALAALCADGKGPADPLRIQFTTLDDRGDLPRITVDLRGVRVEQYQTNFGQSSGAPLERLTFSYGQMSVRVVTYSSGVPATVIDSKTFDFP